MTRDLEQLEIHGIWDDTALGGVLSGKLPNPGMAAGAVGSTNLATGIVLQLASTGTTRKVAFGSGTVTWAGVGFVSADTTVTHGLGTTPIFAGAFGNGVSGGGLVTSSVFFRSAAIGATTFSVSGTTPTNSEPISATAGFIWLAIG